MPMRTAKQVIVMRRKFLIDGETKTVRTGKMIAQGAHASMAALLNNADRTDKDVTISTREPEVNAWLNGRFTKVVVYVNTLEELEAVYAKASNIRCKAMITDAGLTEFKGQPQKTCCAIGPGWAEDIDSVTGHLPLL